MYLVATSLVLVFALTLVVAPSRASAQSADGPQTFGLRATASAPTEASYSITGSFGHARGLEQLYQAYLVITRGEGGAGCYVFYEPSTNSLGLRMESGGWVNTGPLGDGRRADNSWCGIDASRTQVRVAGGRLDVTFGLVFHGRLEGEFNAHLIALDTSGRATPWAHRTPITIGRGPLPPVTVSARTVDATATQPTTISAVYSDPNHWLAIAEAYMVVSSGVGGAGCYVRYVSTTSTLQVRGDSDAWIDGGKPGAGDGAESAACRLDARGTKVSGEADRLTIEYVVTFKPDFTGERRVYLIAVDETDQRTYWDDRGAIAIAEAPLTAAGQAARFVRTELLTWSFALLLLGVVAVARRVPARAAWGASAVVLVIAGMLATLNLGGAEAAAALAFYLLFLGAVLEGRERFAPDFEVRLPAVRLPALRREKPPTS